MLFSSLFSASLLFLAACAAPVAPGEFLAVAPKVIYPSSGTIWFSGDEQHVNWDTSNIPDEAKGYTVKIVLGHLTSNPDSENLDTDNPLAINVPIMDGTASITVPTPDDLSLQYVVAVIGDSGNISESFMII